MVFFFLSYLLLQYRFSKLSAGSEQIASFPKIYTFKILNEYPHYHKQYDSAENNKIEYDDSFNVNAVPFTQGLTFLNSSVIIESAGLYKGSFIRFVEFPSMNNLKHRILEPDLWGEGAAIYRNNIIQLTWTSGILISYPLKYNLAKRKLYSIPFVGWGLTSDNNDRLWATTGSDKLLELEIPDFDSKNENVTIKNEIKLTCLGRPLFNVNEIEYIPATKTIWGNIFLSNMIVEINPDTGKCLSIAYLGDIYDPKNSKIYKHFDISNDVLNGIAYHDSLEKFNNYTSSKYEPIFIVTGKRWPRMYLVKLEELSVNNESTYNTNFTDLNQYYKFYRQTYIHS
ncbi:glutamine cyclotransferase [Cryptosporidium ryanae]|uniref:glutamine cyclotransferase n=1 Tax=Cryptosporidium ryanae TaxID=515981 RepID=UPI00351A2FF5|nr:glutamine cyclotransferase [Cryptosporidium ryanae]